MKKTLDENQENKKTITIETEKLKDAIKIIDLYTRNLLDKAAEYRSQYAIDTLHHAIECKEIQRYLEGILYPEEEVPF